MSTLSSGTKICCKCGKDLTTEQRLKDSKGLYWCFTCSYGKKSEEKPSGRGKMVKILVLVGLLIIAGLVLDFYIL